MLSEANQEPLGPVLRILSPNSYPVLHGPFADSFMCRLNSSVFFSFTSLNREDRKQILSFIFWNVLNIKPSFPLGKELVI